MTNIRKVAFFMPELRRGGVEIVFFRLASGMLELGMAVDIVVVDASADLRNEVPSGARLVDLRARRVRHAIWALARYLHDSRPDVVLSGQDHANVAAVCARRLARSRALLLLTAHSPLRSNVEGRRGMAGAILPAAVRLFYPMADSIVSVSTNVAADLVALAPRLEPMLRVIPNPTIPDDLASLTRPPTGVPWLDATGGPPVLLAVGRLDPVKDYPTLLSAFASVRANRPVRLVILGEGPERPHLQSLACRLGIDEDVAFIGGVANPFPYYARARLLCITSKFEAGPMVLIEALACSLPVVATDSGGLVEGFLGDGRLGRKVPVGDVGAFAAAISATLDDVNGIVPPSRQLEPFRVRAATTAYIELMDSLTRSR